MKKKPTILESEIIDKVLVIFTAIWLCHECSAASRFRYEPSLGTVNFGKNIDGNSHDPCGYTKHILCKYNQNIMRNISRFCVAALFLIHFSGKPSPILELIDDWGTPGSQGTFWHFWIALFGQKGTEKDGKFKLSSMCTSKS